MVATVGDPADPVIIHTFKARGGQRASSDEKEKVALVLALGWARANCPTERISICSDSQSLLKAVQGGEHDAQIIRQRLNNREDPPPSCGFKVARAYQATRPPTNWRKQLPLPSTRHADPSRLPP